MAGAKRHGFEKLSARSFFQILPPLSARTLARCRVISNQVFKSVQWVRYLMSPTLKYKLVRYGMFQLKGRRNKIKLWSNGSICTKITQKAKKQKISSCCKNKSGTRNEPKYHIAQKLWHIISSYLNHSIISCL